MLSHAECTLARNVTLLSTAITWVQAELQRVQRCYKTLCRHARFRPFLGGTHGQPTRMMPDYSYLIILIARTSELIHPELEGTSAISESNVILIARNLS
jgi:hypothetical protein